MGEATSNEGFDRARCACDRMIDGSIREFEDRLEACGWSPRFSAREAVKLLREIANAVEDAWGNDTTPRT